MIRAVIFDLNGVIINSIRLYDALREKVDVDEEEVHQEVREVLREARKTSYPSIYSLLKSKLDAWRVSMTKDELFARWFGSDSENTELMTYIKTLKEQGLKVIVLSNSFPERTLVYDQKFPFIRNFFDKVYYSHETGHHKPEPKAYQQILDDFQLRPEECVYFDDSEKNVTVATSLGMQAFLYKGVEDTKQKIEARR